MKIFHYCAACRHYESIKEKERKVYRCGRLGYETKPKYQFSCWDPKETVRNLMEKEGYSSDWPVKNR